MSLPQSPEETQREKSLKCSQTLSEEWKFYKANVWYSNTMRGIERRDMSRKACLVVWGKFATGCHSKPERKLYDHLKVSFVSKIQILNMFCIHIKNIHSVWCIYLHATEVLCFGSDMTRLVGKPIQSILRGYWWAITIFKLLFKIPALLKLISPVIRYTVMKFNWID